MNGRFPRVQGGLSITIFFLRNLSNSLFAIQMLGQAIFGDEAKNTLSLASTARTIFNLSKLESVMETSACRKLLLSELIITVHLKSIEDSGNLGFFNHYAMLPKVLSGRK